MVEESPVVRFDLTEVSRNAEQLGAALPGVELHFAYKSCPIPEVAAVLAQRGVGFEIASTAELRALQAIGALPHDVLFSHPIKAPHEIVAAYAAGIRRFAFDSWQELEKLAEHAPGAEVFVRLAVDNAGSAFPLSRKFGVEADEAAALMKQAGSLGLVPWGVAFHVGSQSVRPAAWQTAIEAAARLMAELLDAGIRLEKLNIGGGFPARYSADVPAWGEIGLAISSATAALPYPVKLLAEPGRSLVASAATAVATVVGRASRGPEEWVYLDIGVFSGLMEALEDGELVRYPVEVIGRENVELQPFVLAGPTCDQADLIAADVRLPASIAIGDQVLLHSVGAYSVSYLGDFCGLPRPSVVIS